MTIDMQAVHYVMLICASLAAGLPKLAEAFPAGAKPWLDGAAAVFVLLTAVLGALSGPATKTMEAPKP